MNAGNAVDLLDPTTGVFVHAVAGGGPIRLHRDDVGLGNQAFDRTKATAHTGRLAQPTGLFPTDRRSNREQVDLPFGVEAPPALPPVKVPIPDLREDHHGKGQELRIDAEALHLALGWGHERPEPQPEMLHLLGSGLLAPDPVPLHAEGGKGRRLEAKEFGHLVVQAFGRDDDAGFLRRPRR